MLAQAVVARSWGGEVGSSVGSGLMGRRPPGVQCRAAGATADTKQPPRAHSPGRAWRCRPLAWRGLVQAGSGRAQRALLPGRERSPRQAPPPADPPRLRIRLTAPASPGETLRVVVPREGRPRPLPGPRAPASGSPAPGALPSRRLPLIDSGPEERPREPRMGGDVQPPQRGRPEGSPQGHLECPG